MISVDPFFKKQNFILQVNKFSMSSNLSLSLNYFSQNL